MQALVTAQTKRKRFRREQKIGAPWGAMSLWVMALGAIVACGRPATASECDEIVGRITELELRARGEAGDSSAEVRGAQEALRKSSLQDCVGRRISDEAMQCVRSAKTAQEIVSECF